MISGSGTTPTTNADIFVNGVVTTTTGSITVDSAHSIDISANLNAGLDILLREGVLLTGDVAAVAGRDVIFNGTIDDDAAAATSSNLTITASRDIAFYGNIGQSNAVQSLTVTSAAGVFFGDADGGSPDAQPIATVHTTGAINIGSQAAIGADGISLDGGNAANSVITLTTQGSNVRFNGTVRLDSGASIDTGSGLPGDITFTSDSPINSQAGEHNSLALNAGTGSVFFNANIGATQSLGSLAVSSAAGGVTFGVSDSAVSGGSGPVTIVNTDGAIDIGAGTTAANVIGGTGITVNGGPLPGSSITITTTGDNVRLNGAVTLKSNLSIDTGSGTPGDISFTSNSPIDSQASEHNDLAPNAGIGSVFFSGNIGAAQSLGSLTVLTAAGGVTFGAADVASTGAGGPVTVVRTDGAIDIGAGTSVANVIGGTGIVFNGGSSP